MTSKINDNFGLVRIKYEKPGDPSNEPSALIANYLNSQPSYSDDTEYGYYQSTDKSGTKNRHRTLVCETSDNVRYTGQTFGPEASTATSFCKYLIGIYNPKKNKVQLVDAQLFNMRPKYPDEAAGTDNTEEAEKTYRDKTDQLIKTFGSSKGRRLITSREKNQVTSQTMEQVVGQAIEDATIDLPESASNVPRDSMDAYQLTCHSEATRPEDVYLLHELIDEIDMDALYTPAVLFINSNSANINEWREKQTYPNFILRHLEYLPTEHDRRTARSRYLLYLHYLIMMFKLKSSDLRKKAPLSEDVPQIIMKKLFEKFTITIAGRKNSRCMTSSKKDSVLLHILVLCLHLNDFNVDMTSLRKDLGGKDLTKYFHQLRCRVSTKIESSGAPASYASLTLPLAPPKERPGRGH